MYNLLLGLNTPFSLPPPLLVYYYYYYFPFNDIVPFVFNRLTDKTRGNTHSPRPQLSLSLYHLLGICCRQFKWQCLKTINKKKKKEPVNFYSIVVIHEIIMFLTHCRCNWANPGATYTLLNYAVTSRSILSFPREG